MGDVSTESAIALGNLRRNGYAVTTIVVLQGGGGPESFGHASGTRFLDADGAVDKIGRLIAEGIEVRHVDHEAAIGQLCSEQLVR